MARAQTVETDIPARMDRLPWARWHWMVVMALGITWILDGLEVTIVSTISSVLQKKSTLNLSDIGVTAAASGYIAGAVMGALVFGYLTDRLGRKKLFLVTLAWYTIFTVGTAFSWSVFSYVGFRFLTGLGIGGEYAAINSAIDELIPARQRGWTDLGINSSYWMGTILASALSLVLLDPARVPVNLGWRFSFGIGALLAVCVLFVRRFVPESPRWLMTHGRIDEAETIVRSIEGQVERESGRPLPPPGGETVSIDTGHRVGFLEIARTMVTTYPRRSLVAVSLMITQAFLYNAIFFTESLVLTTFFKVPSSSVGYYMFPFAVGNLLGPWILGHLFDTIGRRKMIAGTYIISALLLIGTGVLFKNGSLNATTITICWSVIFFFASAGASSAYLTASEIFPMETRAMAIAFVYAVGTLAGGSAAPLLFGALIATHSSTNVFYGYLLGAGLMIIGGLVEAFLGVDAEGKALEEVAAPLSATGKEARRAPAMVAAT